MEVRMDMQWVRKSLPIRPRHANKGTLGTLNILAGSSRYRGAAVLAASGALRAGAGLVRVAAIEKVCAALAAQLPCCLLHPLDENAEGGIAAAELPAFLDESATAVLAGCGMGDGADTGALVAGLLERGSVPMVLDADALNVMAGQVDGDSNWALRQRCFAALDAAKHPLILTPHIGEMARLLGLDKNTVISQQSSIALDFARAHNCVVVLKSHVTVVATPAGDTYINDRAGNAGLARGGSGDVLAGIIASLLAQGVRPEIAAACGVWLHASAADRAAAKTGETGLSPAQLPEYLCGIWREMEAGHHLNTRRL